jgi:hypothetical protein
VHAPDPSSATALVALLLSWLSGIHTDLGSVPDWIAGVGTAAAFSIALLLFRRQLNELRDAEESRRRAQAAQVSGWCKEERQNAGSTSRRLRLRNGSGEPVYQCAALFASSNHATWTARDHDEWQAAIGSSAARYGARGTMVLAPGETACWTVEDEELAAPRGEIAPVFLIFRDAQGTQWSRSPRGVLLPFDSPVLDDEEMLDLMTRSESRADCS